MACKTESVPHEAVISALSLGRGLQLQPKDPISYVTMVGVVI